MDNRYTELTASQREKVDAYINALASSGGTEDSLEERINLVEAVMDDVTQRLKGVAQCDSCHHWVDRRDFDEHMDQHEAGILETRS